MERLYIKHFEDLADQHLKKYRYYKKKAEKFKKILKEKKKKDGI